MNFYLCASLLFAAAVFGDDSTVKDANGREVKVYTRLIPADVLRDFPGLCYASTKCSTIEPNKTWELTPFCGRSTCMPDEKDPAKLLELVEDCGPLPLKNDKCKLDTEKTKAEAPFPTCCPIFTCEPGAKLEYPDINAEPKA